MPELNDLPSQRIAAALRQKIVSGKLGPGDRIPSTRQLVRDWGVAMATASRALAILRDEGLVTTRTGSGTVVRGGHGTSRPALTPDRVLGMAVQMADREGLEAVSIRKLAGVLKVSPMSLYRHVAGRDELETLMVRTVFKSSPLPDPMPAGWRERLETVYRRQWRLYRAHPWLAELTLVTRPPLAPEAMLHTEWALEALAELRLDAPTRVRTALALAALVHGLALGVLHEVRAEQQSRLRNEEWWATIDAEASELLHGADFRRLAELNMLPTETFGLTGVDETFELALGHYLDGLEARQQYRRQHP
ncbi:TetR/AcrR family transcriptional regulator C-terminal domain-containing protein [Nocardia carnea]|uniref:TetR/AcrR family transcriptional regulator C-terminal domain-containing protein n=1 Tax=Nocardia carnea TaxID=37328 RepID=UPI0024560E50|nr:TetR/AcrR family transcriptional regulator C-terminal domain-containing protein [Nocardia carnea]